MDTSSSERSPEHDQECRCPRRRTVPVLAILIGLEFFFAEIGIFTWGFVNVTWPILLVIAGVAGLFRRRCHCDHHHHG